MPRTKTVDEYVENHPHWSAALKKLRKILDSIEL